MSYPRPRFGAGVQFSLPLIDFAIDVLRPAHAGVQFSLPLIDFCSGYGANLDSWGSVLITPDRLQTARLLAEVMLGFSSHYP